MRVAEINFTDRNAVEKFLEGDKFRSCANLECSPVELEHDVLYMPMCMEGRFNREGIAEHLDMPRPPRPLSPLTYTTIPVWAPLVSCPADCKGYQNRTVAKVKKTIASSVRTLLGRNKTGTTIESKKGFWDKYILPIVIGLIVTVGGGLILAHYFEKPQSPAASPVQIQTSGDKNPVVQGNQGNVSIDNSTSEQPKKIPQNSNSDSASKKHNQQQQNNSGGVNTQQQSSGNNSPNVSAPNGIAIGGNNSGIATVNNNPPVNPNATAVMYDCAGNRRSSGPTPNTGLSVTLEVGHDESALKELVQLNDARQYSELLDSCRGNIAAEPEWLTPYLFCGLGYFGSGGKLKTGEMLP